MKYLYKKVITVFLGKPPFKKSKKSKVKNCDSAPWDDFSEACKAITERKSFTTEMDPAGHIGQFIAQSLRNMTSPVQKKCIDGLMGVIYNDPTDAG